MYLAGRSITFILDMRPVCGEPLYALTQDAS